jgi:tetratricopeptide (TPR) repeat protein
MSTSSSASPAVTAYKLMCEGRLEPALPYAWAAVTDTTVCTPAHGMLATILCALGRREEAESVVVSALQLGAGTADAYDALAHVSITLGQPERANALYRQAVEREPLTSRFWYNLASSARGLGRIAESEAACNRSIALDRRAYSSYLLRSELRVQTVDSNHVSALESLLADRNMDDRGRAALGYALAKELDDLERYDDAFHWFSEAAGARRRRLSYDVSVDEKKIQRIIETHPVKYLRAPTPSTDSARYIFIVGLPRSGTTLLERILTGLKGVRTNGETDNFSRALLDELPPGSEDIFFRAAQADPLAVARNYAQRGGAPRDGGAIIEKLPLNYLYLGAIHRALPEAKLVWMKRLPLASCFAMYRTLFGDAYPFSYDFDDLARYYAAYDRLMNHWRLALGGHICEVAYEDLVRQPQTVGAAVAEHCGLGWQASATRVENNTGASFTASASQVRRAIYTSSVDRWRHYSKHLEPLARRLTDLGVNINSP